VPETCLNVQIVGVIFPASKHSAQVLRREVRRSRSLEIHSRVDLAIPINSAKMASNWRPNQRTALVAGMVFCCYRSRFRLALCIRVVRWKESFLLRTRSG